MSDYWGNGEGRKEGSEMFFYLTDTVQNWNVLFIREIFKTISPGTFSWVLWRLLCLTSLPNEILPEIPLPRERPHLPLAFFLSLVFSVPLPCTFSLTVGVLLSLWMAVLSKVTASSPGCLSHELTSGQGNLEETGRYQCESTPTPLSR